MVTVAIIIATACVAFPFGFLFAAIIAGAKEEDAYRAGYCEGYADGGRK